MVGRGALVVVAVLVVVALAESESTNSTSSEHGHEEEEEGCAVEVSRRVVIPVLGCFALVVIAAAYLEKWRVTHWVPESLVAVLFGIVLGLLLNKTPDSCGQGNVSERFLSVDFLNLVLLPPIMFTSGFTLSRRDFLAEVGLVHVYAIVGTLISVAVVTALVFVTGKLGLHSVCQFQESFAFASLISAVDPVATLAVFESLRVDRLLNILVLGESIVNDAASIALFEIANHGKSDTPHDQCDDWGAVRVSADAIVVGVLQVLCGGIGLGVGCGVLFTFVLRHSGLKPLEHLRTKHLLEEISGQYEQSEGKFSRENYRAIQHQFPELQDVTFEAFTQVQFLLSNEEQQQRFLHAVRSSMEGDHEEHHEAKPKLELVLLLVACYLSFMAGEATHTSGILSALFSGMVMGAYTQPNLSVQGHSQAKLLLGTLSSLADLTIFVMTGAYITTRWVSDALPFGLLVTLFCLVARACNVFPLSYLVFLWRSVTVKREVVRAANPRAKSKHYVGPQHNYTSMLAKLNTRQVRTVHYTSAFADTLDMRKWRMAHRKWGKAKRVRVPGATKLVLPYGKYSKHKGSVFEEQALELGDDGTLFHLFEKCFDFYVTNRALDKVRAGMYLGALVEYEDGTWLAAMVQRNPSVVPFNFQFLMWFAGLRGAIALSLAGELNELFPHRDLMEVATCVVILLTLGVLGSLTPLVISMAKIPTNVPEDDPYLLFLQDQSKTTKTLVNFVHARLFSPLLLGTPWNLQLDTGFQKELPHIKPSNSRGDPSVFTGAERRYERGKGEAADPASRRHSESAPHARRFSLPSGHSKAVRPKKHILAFAGDEGDGQELQAWKQLSVESGEGEAGEPVPRRPSQVSPDDPGSGSDSQVAEL